MRYSFTMKKTLHCFEDLSPHSVLYFSSSAVGRVAVVENSFLPCPTLGVFMDEKNNSRPTRLGCKLINLKYQNII